MDNFHIDMTAERAETLREAIAIAFRHNAPGGKATHWIEGSETGAQEWEGATDTRKVLVFLWNGGDSK